MAHHGPNHGLRGGGRNSWHVCRELKSPREAHVGYPAAENNWACALSLATFGNLYDASCVVMQC